MKLSIDATDVVHGIQKVHLRMPVRPGPVTLKYPKWVPGEHAFNGPITQVMNLHFHANRRELTWRRDERDAFSFHLTIPEGSEELAVDFDFFSPPESFGSGFGKSPNVSPDQLVLLFSQFLMYSQASTALQDLIDTSVKLPERWLSDCSLPVSRAIAGWISLPIVPLSTLLDSPLIAGRFLRTLDLTTIPYPTRVSITAAQPSELLFDPEPLKEHLRALTREASAVFGAPPYPEYVWLVSLSDSFVHDGTEHAASSDIREDEKLLTDPAFFIDMRLFPHEYVHVWNGIHRIPEGLRDPDLPSQSGESLLWVYEGLTRYYGDLILFARSGFASVDATREYLAFVAGQMASNRPGRSWRSLADTAAAVPDYEDAPRAWTGVRRGSDYYNEALLIWLEVDVRIRELSRGTKSLDDFCRQFFREGEKSYSREDLIANLNRIAPYDWSSFFESRVDQLNAAAPLGGLQQSGWMLTYDSHPNRFMQQLADVSRVDDLSASIGVWISAAGIVLDVLPGSVAYEAGMAPGQQILVVDGQGWSAPILSAAIAQTRQSARSIHLTISVAKRHRDVELRFDGGLRYPHLVRTASCCDVLNDILAARVPDAQYSIRKEL